jgi:hypothetical protein
MSSENQELLVNAGFLKIEHTNTVSNIKHYGIQFITDTVVETWSMTDQQGVVHDLVALNGMNGIIYTIDDLAMIIPKHIRTGTCSIKLSSGGINLLKIK